MGYCKQLLRKDRRPGARREFACPFTATFGFHIVDSLYRHERMTCALRRNAQQPQQIIGDLDLAPAAQLFAGGTVGRKARALSPQERETAPA